MPFYFSGSSENDMKFLHWKFGLEVDRMARVRRDDSMSMSDIVFSDGESMNFGPDIYSPRSMNDVFSPNMSASSMGDLYSPRLSGRDQHSPAMSNYSTFSQEVKYIFDPNFGAKQQTVKDLSVNSTEDDYSQIQFSNKKSNLQRKSSTASQYSHRSQYSSYSNQKSVSQKVAPPPPPRTASSSSQLGEGTPRKHPVLSHSVSAVNGASYYYPYNQTRRKTWSPEGLQLGLNTTGMKREQRIRSYSNEQLIEQPLVENRDPIYEELDAGPPKLAPVSGMLNKVCTVFHANHILRKFSEYTTQCLRWVYMAWGMCHAMCFTM